MDVRLSNILNSAEKFIRDKGFPGSNPSPMDSRPGTTSLDVQDRAEFSNLLTGKFQAIQSKLSDLQSSLTREQMRLSYLNDERTGNSSELAKILFGKEPLFPELEFSKNLALDDLKRNSEKNLSEIEKEIRYKEVENENVMALRLQDGSSGFQNLLSGIGSISWKPMNEKNVQRLIEF